MSQNLRDSGILRQEIDATAFQESHNVIDIYEPLFSQGIEDDVNRRDKNQKGNSALYKTTGEPV